MKKKPKSLIFSYCYIYGGSEKLMLLIIKNKIIREHYQIIFAFGSHKIYDEAINEDYSEEEKKNILFPFPIASNAPFFYKINLLSIPLTIKKIIKIPFYIIDKLGFYFIFNFLTQIYVLLKFSPDIVHINNGGYPGASSCSTMVFAARFMRIRHIVYQINNATFKTKNPIIKYFDRFINRYVSCFITASENSKEKLVDDRMFDSNKII